MFFYFYRPCRSVYKEGISNENGVTPIFKLDMVAEIEVSLLKAQIESQLKTNLSFKFEFIENDNEKIYHHTYQTKKRLTLF